MMENQVAPFLNQINEPDPLSRDPVHAAMVDAPERYIWSSARTNLGLAFDPCVIPHPVYTALGTDENARIEAYGEWLRSGVADEDLAAIRTHLQQERALGSPRFQAMVAKTLNRPVAVRPRGRPRKALDLIAQPTTREPNSNG